MTIKEKIQECIDNNRRFSIMVDMYSYQDALVYDTSDPDCIRMLCKYNNTALINVEPTFGNVQTGTGLQEVIIPYDKINAINCLDVSEDLLTKFETKYPELYKVYKNSNKVEGVSWDKAGRVAGTGYQKPPVEPAVKVSLEEGVNL